MDFTLLVKEFSDKILTIPYMIILLGSIIITFKTRFVQIRMFPKMLRLFLKSPKKNENGDEQTIQSRNALFTAISTSIGIGNIVGPIIAIKLGGPGALLGFMIAVFFGAATIFTEVTLAVAYRTPLKDGGFAGGPMQYLKKAFHPALGKFYGFTVAILLLAWSTNQANTLADILQTYSVPTYATGLFLAILTLIYLIGGIKKIGQLSSKIVPVMFVMFCTISLWIIFINASKIPEVISLIFKSAFTAKALSGASIGLLLRWAIAKGTQASEGGVGTATIPHSMAKVKIPTDQGILAMLSTYSVGFVCTLSGFVVLLTETYKGDTPLGISMLAKSFAMHTPYHIGSVVLVICTFLFALGSIIGNSYNGSQGFLHVTKNRFVNLYYLAMGVIIFFGSIFPVEFVWSVVDFFVIPVALINISAVVILLFKRKDLFSKI